MNNKLLIIILSLLLLVSMVFNFSTEIKTVLLMRSLHINYNYMLKNGAICDIDAAINYAKIVFTSVYGIESVETREPYKGRYDEQNKVWIISGTLPEDSLGGVPAIVFKQSGHVLIITHGK